MLENIIAGIIATFICSMIYKLLEFIKNRKNEKPNINSKNGQVTLRELSIAKKQFFACLIYLFIVIAGLIFDIFVYDFLLVFILVTSFFAFILIWGSFDLVFYPFKNYLQEREKEFPNKDSNSDK